MSLRFSLFLCLFLMFSARAAPESYRDYGNARVFQQKYLLGYIERAQISPAGPRLSAKLDTGADTSSIHAQGVDIYRVANGGQHAKFHIVSDAGQMYAFDVPVIRFSRIKKKQGGWIERPVVSLQVCVGGQWAEAEVNLADRSAFEYDVLIGREFLNGRIFVDSGRQFVATSSC